MATGYAPIIVFAILVTGFAVLSLAASALLRPRLPNPAKEAPYECGITPARLPKAERFPVSFYIVAMLFIIFDVETIFLFPWAVQFRALGLFGLVEMIVFVGLVFVAYLYVWHKGGLEWEGPGRRPLAATAAGAAAAGEPLPVALERGPGETRSEDARRPVEAGVP